MSTPHITNTESNTFRVTASAYSVQAYMTVATPELAAEVAARFPKSAKVLSQQLSTFDRETGANLTLGTVHFAAYLMANGVNGGRNETGIKRYHTFVRAAERLGYAVEYDATAYANSLTEAELAEAVAR